MVNIVNEKLRDKISRGIYERRKAEVGGDTANLAADESEDEDLIGYDAIEPGLPPASSDRQKWWLENGKMARSSISPPKADNPAHQTILNPKRPTNPYMPSDEPDWVNVPRSESRLSSFSSMSTSPYEHVNHSMLLSSSASSSAPRKLPPPYDPSALPAKVGRLHIGEDTKGSQADGPPPPPPPRRQTSMGFVPSANSSAASVSQKRKPVNAPAPGPKPGGGPQQPTAAKHKSPPPVAKKPAHLTATISPASSNTSASLASNATSAPTSNPPSESAAPTAIQLPGLPYRSTPNPPINGTSTTTWDDTPPPQLSRRANTAAASITQSRPPGGIPGGIPLVGLADPAIQRKPQLPARKPTVAGTPAVGVAPGLGVGTGSRIVPGAGERLAGEVAAVAQAQAQAQTRKPAPAPPASRKAAQQTQSAQPVDLLGDEGEGDGVVDVGGWEALRPS